MDCNYLEVLREYIKKYGNTESPKNINLHALQNDLDLLEWCCDFVDYLFSNIGLDEEYEPNSIGRELDKCLEYLNSIRYQYHDPI